MKNKQLWVLLGCIWGLFSCGNGNNHYDATGTFEATEIMVSAEAQGKLMELSIREGELLQANHPEGYIDSIQLYLKRRQLIANNRAVINRRADVSTQIAALREQIAKQQTEKKRFEALFEHRAATQKQVDDIDAQLKMLEKQLQAQISSLENGNQSIDGESEAILLQQAQLEDQLRRCVISSPIRGTVLTKYVEPGEFVNVGMPLFKVADLKHIFLRAYITSEQLSQIKLNQEVAVFADYGNEAIRKYPGRVIWIGDKSEFTPKGIQTRNERANLVYPVKILVENDGFIRIGMYGGILLNDQ